MGHEFFFQLDLKIHNRINFYFQIDYNLNQNKIGFPYNSRKPN
jgi:hypothetical protein